MFSQKRIVMPLWILASLLLSVSLVTGCTGQAPVEKTFRTWLLVRAPDNPLPLDRPVTVKSRTEDPDNGISHVELYAVELPNGESNVLIDATAAPFDQTVFTASQTFIPKAEGDYVIKVVGYNKKGQKRESEYIRFTVRQM